MTEGILQSLTRIGGSRVSSEWWDTSGGFKKNCKLCVLTGCRLESFLWVKYDLLLTFGKETRKIIWCVMTSVLLLCLVAEKKDRGNVCPVFNIMCPMGA